MYFNDNEADIDLLNYSPVAKTIVKFIQHSPETPITVGVHGDWGAGKSTVLKLTENLLNADDVLCIRFNGWTFQGFEDAKTVLIQTILEELEKKKGTTAKVKQTVVSLLKRVKWLKLAKTATVYGATYFAAAHGVPVAPPVGAGAEGLAPATSEENEFLESEKAKTVPEQVNAFLEEFRELLKTAEIKQLVVLVDDLDRCLPETTIQTLEAIRLFLFAPNTAFVIAADEAMIEYAVRRHFPDLPGGTADTKYARNYLEKLIQVPFRIPALGPQETRAYITLLFIQAEVTDSSRFEKVLTYVRDQMRHPWDTRPFDISKLQDLAGKPNAELRDMLVFAEQIAPTLVEGTQGNPRQLKRFVNALVLRYSVAEARGFATAGMKPLLAKLMLAERFGEKGFYDHLAREIANSVDGKPEFLKKLETVAQNEKSAEVESLDSDIRQWLESDWVRRWARIEPTLSDVDLRPHIFVASETKNFLTVIHTTPSEVLVENLMSGSFAVAKQASALAQLTQPEADFIFQVLQTRILQTENLNNEPRGRRGLVALSERQPHLQPRLLQFIKEIPINNVGTWITTGWERGLALAQLKEGFVRILESWAAQSENSKLKKAAAGALKIQGKQK